MQCKISVRAGQGERSAHNLPWALLLLLLFAKNVKAFEHAGGARWGGEGGRPDAGTPPPPPLLLLLLLPSLAQVRELLCGAERLCVGGAVRRIR